MSITSDLQPLDSPPAARSLKLFVAGALLAGGITGLACNRVLGGNPERGARVGQLLAAGAGTLPAPAESQGGGAVPVGTAGVSGVRIRLPEVTPPADPFAPATADPTGVRIATASVSIGPAAGAVPSPADRGKPAPALPPATGEMPAEGTNAAPPASLPEDMALIGIIQGEPPLAVVRQGGQSLFLKVGDQVADTWRLVEIKERSAIFQLGEQRVDLSIKGDSSQ